MVYSIKRYSECFLKSFKNWGTFLVFISVLLNSSCRHTSDTSLSLHSDIPTLSASKIDRSLQKPDVISVNQLVEDPEPYIDREIIVSGNIKDFQVKKGAKGYSILELSVRDAKEKKQPPPPELQITHLKLANKLNQIGERMLESAHNIEVSFLDPESFKDLSYNLKLEGNRIEALGNFFRAKEMFDIGKNVESIAHGYFKLGDALVAISQIKIENEPNILIEQIDIQPIELHTPTQENGFQLAISDITTELSIIAEELIGNRYKIIDQVLALDSPGISNSKAYSLLSISDLLEAKGWESRLKREESAHRQFEVMSQSFNLLGSGLNEIYHGFQDLGDNLTIKVIPTPMEYVDLPLLKCAYIGYNDHIIQDCESKINQLGRNGEITVKGQVIKGSLMEELNVLWINMHSITLDNLTIDLAYDDIPTTWRNLTNFYDWVKETTN